MPADRPTDCAPLVPPAPADADVRGRAGAPDVAARLPVAPEIVRQIGARPPRIPAPPPAPATSGRGSRAGIGQSPSHDARVGARSTSSDPPRALPPARRRGTLRRDGPG